MSVPGTLNCSLHRTRSQTGPRPEARCLGGLHCTASKHQQDLQQTRQEISSTPRVCACIYCLRFAIPAEAISGTRRGTLELQDFSKTKKKYKKCSWRRGEAVLTRTCQKGEKRSGLQYLFELESNDECLQERHQRSEFMRWQEVRRG